MYHSIAIVPSRAVRCTVSVLLTTKYPVICANPVLVVNAQFNIIVNTLSAVGTFCYATTQGLIILNNLLFRLIYTPNAVTSV